MILQALTRYYEDLLSRGEIAAPGWAPAKISLALYINENGELTQIVPTMVEGTKGKKTVMQPQLMVLPAAVKRTVSIASNFLWDNSAYLLGIDQKGKPERSRECFAAAAKHSRCWIASIRPMPAQYWLSSTLGNRNARQSIRRLSGSSMM